MNLDVLVFPCADFSLGVGESILAGGDMGSFPAERVSTPLPAGGVIPPTEGIHAASANEDPGAL